MLLSSSVVSTISATASRAAFGSVDEESLEGLFSFLDATSADKPLWRLGAEDDERDDDDGPHLLHCERNTPGVVCQTVTAVDQAIKHSVRYELADTPA